MKTNDYQIQTQKCVINLSQIYPGNYQSRETFEREEMENLARTIKTHGLINPPLVCQQEDAYLLIAGERRWRALCAVHLSEQGVMTWTQAIDMVSADDARQQLHNFQQYLTAIDVEVKVAPPHSNHRVLAVIENGQHRKLNPLEEAQDYKGLLDDGCTPAEVAAWVGKSSQTITDTVSLLDLAPEVQAMLRAGQLDKTQGVDLATVKDQAAQIGLAQRAVKAGWNTATTEAACRAYNKSIQTSPRESQSNNGHSATTIPLSQVQTVSLYQPRSQHHLSPAGIEYILGLAEECCECCRDQGFSSKCLACEGFVEFANRLIREVNYES